METTSSPKQQARKTLKHETAVIIPVYLPPSVAEKRGADFVTETATACVEELATPDRVCLSVDGCAGQEAAEAIRSRLGVSVVSSVENRGKFQAVANGVRHLIENDRPQFVAVVDQDGDHFAWELPNFLQAALDIRDAGGTERSLVLGRRLSRHRPMGFLRGELEELADRVLLDALSYRAAVTGNPLRLEYAFAFDEFPDFHSGYKLFTMETARAVFATPPRLAGVTEDCFYRHACEAVMTVEAIESGAYLGVVNRSTLNEQPVSTFGLLDRCRLVADKIIWPCRRLDIPAPFVRQWMDNHIPRLLLNTFMPQGREELQTIRTLVMEAMEDTTPPASSTPMVPRFV